MHNAGHRRHNAEIAECLLSPLEELIAFAVAQEFHFGVAVERIGCGEEINLHRVVNDQVNRHKRIDLLRVAAETCNCGAHRSQVNDGGHAREILHDNTTRQKWNARARAFRRPRGDVLHIVLCDLVVIALTEGGFEHDTNRERQFAEFVETSLLQRIEAEDDVLLLSHFQYITGLK